MVRSPSNLAFVITVLQSFLSIVKRHGGIHNLCVDITLSLALQSRLIPPTCTLASEYYNPGTYRKDTLGEGSRKSNQGVRRGQIRMPETQGGILMHVDRASDLVEWSRSRPWRIDPWGLVRGLVLLFSSLIVVTILHRLVLFFFGG